MQMYAWKARDAKSEKETRPEGSCEYSGCGRPSYYSWSTREYKPEQATTLVIYLPLNRKGYNSETQTFIACNKHAGLAKRSNVYGYTARFIKPMPSAEETPAIVEVELAKLRNTQDQNAREARAAIVRRLPEERRDFLAPAQKDAEKMATLKDPDDYGLSYIKVEAQGEYRYSQGLTPAEAESLALRLTQLAADARRKMGATEEELS